MINPVETAQAVEKSVSKNSSRKYSIFEASPLYGGVASAECVGSDLFPSAENKDDFYSPKAVAKKLEEIAKKNGFRQCRIGGGEPAINWKHLIKVLELISKTGLHMTLETDGILIGCNENYAKQLSKYENLQVKVIFRGATPEEFSRTTGAGREFFEFQVHALKNLFKAGVPSHPTVVKGLSRPESIERLRDRLETINPSFYDIEEESL